MKKVPFVIVCDHASNFVPSELDRLGLNEAELQRHIAWDIGAAGVARLLAEEFDSPVVLSETSRLVIDCNRQLDAVDLIPEKSDGTVIPGNQNLSESQREARIKGYFEPYQNRIADKIRSYEGFIFLSVHSMTERLGEQYRPWPISFSSYRDRTLVEPLLMALAEFNVGDNQPYDLDPKVDYTTPQHAIGSGLPHLQVEFRQDEIADEDGQRVWAGRFSAAIKKAGLLRARPSE